jgi:hypothetical protein
MEQLPVSFDDTPYQIRAGTTGFREVCQQNFQLIEIEAKKPISSSKA